MSRVPGGVQHRAGAEEQQALEQRVVERRGAARPAKPSAAMPALPVAQPDDADARARAR